MPCRWRGTKSITVRRSRWTLTRRPAAAALSLADTRSGGGKSDGRRRIRMGKKREDEWKRTTAGARRQQTGDESDGTNTRSSRSTASTLNRQQMASATCRRRRRCRRHRRVGIDSAYLSTHARHGDQTSRLHRHQLTANRYCTPLTPSSPVNVKHLASL